jgi:enoyl-CoA hydratase/carnithine racemase
MVDQAAIRARMQAEGVHFHDQLTKPEVTEAIAAFSEKRAPDFSRFD